MYTSVFMFVACLRVALTISRCLLPSSICLHPQIQSQSDFETYTITAHTIFNVQLLHLLETLYQCMYFISHAYNTSVHTLTTLVFTRTTLVFTRLQHYCSHGLHYCSHAYNTTVHTDYTIVHTLTTLLFTRTTLVFTRTTLLFTRTTLLFTRTTLQL